MARCSTVSRTTRRSRLLSASTQSLRPGSSRVHPPSRSRPVIPRALCRVMVQGAVCSARQWLAPTRAARHQPVSAAAPATMDRTASTDTCFKRLELPVLSMARRGPQCSCCRFLCRYAQPEAQPQLSFSPSRCWQSSPCSSRSGDGTTRSGAPDFNPRCHRPTERLPLGDA
jgi:hypothetical protein